MPFVWNREVDSYKTDIFEASTLGYDRAIRLRLKPSDSEPAHTVSIQFPTSAPSDFVSIGSTFSTVQIDRNKFDGMLHMLQTEKPLYFTAYETGGVRFAGVTTDEEALGEGFRDSDATP